MSDDQAVILHNQKRRRARERANASRFCTWLDGIDNFTSPDDLQHYRGRLQETLDKLLSLDDAIHDLLSDEEYQEDIKTCEDYIDRAKRAIQKASRWTDVLSVSAAQLSIHGTTLPTATTPIFSVTHSVKLPPIKL